MTSIPVVWIQLLSGEMPIFEKGADVPFLAMQGNGYDAVLVRMQHRLYFQFIEVSSTIGPEALKPEILKVMRSLFDTWTGLLPEAGKPSFYGVLSGRLQTVDSISFVRIGIGYTTYPIEGIEYGDESRNRELCEANQLPQELVIDSDASLQLVLKAADSLKTYVGNEKLLTSIEEALFEGEPVSQIFLHVYDLATLRHSMKSTEHGGRIVITDASNWKGGFMGELLSLDRTKSVEVWAVTKDSELEVPPGTFYVVPSGKKITKLTPNVAQKWIAYRPKGSCAI